MTYKTFYEYNKYLQWLSVDFKQDFDSTNWFFIFEVMAEIGIPNKLINLTKMTLSNTLNKVKILNKLSDKLLTFHGTWQGNSLSNLLFYIGLKR